MGRITWCELFQTFMTHFAMKSKDCISTKLLLSRMQITMNLVNYRKGWQVNCRSSHSFDPKFIIIVQDLEAWLLADEEAVSKVTQSRTGRRVSRINEPLESISQPKELLYKVLSEARVPYTDMVAQEIAKESDLDKIESRCPSFKEFRQAVIDC